MKKNSKKTAYDIDSLNKLTNIQKAIHRLQRELDVLNADATSWEAREELYKADVVLENVWEKIYSAIAASQNKNA